MNKQALRSLMILNGETGDDLAKVLNVARTTLSLKMNDKSEFTRGEITAIKEHYNLTPKQLSEIFFTK